MGGGVVWHKALGFRGLMDLGSGAEGSRHLWGCRPIRKTCILVLVN